MTTHPNAIRLPLSLEFFPPKTVDGAAKLAAARQLDADAVLRLHNRQHAKLIKVVADKLEEGPPDTRLVAALTATTKTEALSA